MKLFIVARLTVPLLCFTTYLAQAQVATDAHHRHGTMTVRRPSEYIDSEVYKVVEQMPVFPGGDAAYRRYLASTPYPADMRAAGISGKVIVQFVVTPSGKVITPSIIQSNVPKSGEEAVLKMIRNMPAWQAGKQHGQAVYVLMAAPVYFNAP